MKWKVRAVGPNKSESFELMKEGTFAEVDKDLRELSNENPDWTFVLEELIADPNMN
jgi:hypothetical protein